VKTLIILAVSLTFWALIVWGLFEFLVAVFGAAHH